MRARTAILSLGLVLATAVPVAAEGLGFRYHGVVGGGWDSQPDSTGVAFVDADLRLTFGPVGLELGAYGRADRFDTPHETYGTLVLDTAVGTFSLGVPRPAYDDVAQSGLTRLLPWVERMEPQVAYTRSRMTWGAMYAHYLPYGAAWRGEVGGARLAVSIHRVDRLDLNVASAGFSWGDDALSLSAAVEGASDGTTGAKAQIVGQVGRVTAGLGAYASPVPHRGRLAEGFVIWKAGDRFSLGALIQIPTGSGDDTLAAIAADYQLPGGGRLALGLTAEDGDPAATVGLEYKF